MLMCPKNILRTPLLMIVSPLLLLLLWMYFKCKADVIALDVMSNAADGIALKCMQSKINKYNVNLLTVMFENELFREATGASVI